MDEYNNKLSKSSDSLESLEGNSSTVVQGTQPNPAGSDGTAAPDTSGVKPAPESDVATPSVASPPNGNKPDGGFRNLLRFRTLFHKLNIYLLLFCLIIVSTIAILTVAIITGRSKSSQPISNQSLSQSTLSQLATTDATVGDPKQILNVQSNAVFSGKVLIRDALDVAGPLKIGGSLSLPGITVSGTSSFDQVQVNKGLSVSGDTSVQGQLAVQKSITVSGTGTFNGGISTTQVTTNSLQLNGDLNLTKHITAGGPTPSRSNGPALGSGGTSSVSGSDSAGNVAINTGSAPAAGCFATINFVTKFNATPHVLLTPVGSSAAGLDYYVTRNTSGFSICTASAAPASASFGFDYFVLD